jgi:hypothetical protein
LNGVTAASSLSEVEVQTNLAILGPLYGTQTFVYCNLGQQTAYNKSLLLNLHYYVQNNCVVTTIVTDSLAVFIRCKISGLVD